MTDQRPDAPTESSETTDLDWENRRLCPDGNCIGVIGPDGRCKECGRRDDAEASEISDPPEQTDTSTVTNENEPENDPDLDDIPDPDWENRTLCPDGNCIGVIGPDGRCKECGKRYEADEE